MALRLLIDAVHPNETRIAIVDNGRINDFDFVTSAKKQLKGNIYLAKITRVEPSLQAAFVEYGSGKQGFLPFAEIHPDYYQIPVADRERLLKEAEAIAEDADTTAEEVSGRETQKPSPESAPEPEDVFLNAERQLIAQLHETPVMHGEIPVEPVKEETVESTLEYTPAAESAENIVQLNETPLHETREERHAEASEPTETETIDTLASEEEAVRRESRPVSFYRRYKIQEVIKRNQIVLVQVIKEERGNKGVSLTTFISLAGRYCVLMPNSPKGGGISRKISSGEDRRRLKEISSELKLTRGMSAIIRTAGIDRSRADIQRDYEYLVKLWESIREQTLSSKAPALIYEEGDIIKRTIRDLYSSNIEEIIVAGEAGYEQAKNFLTMILPGSEVNIKLYQDNIPLFHAYNIEEQLNSMYDQSVKLRSGGYIVLNPTEALISIDVNSGRSTGERNIEETATKTNLEAAAEIARQLRLRDLAGLIVIDFIDMADSRNRRAVERALRDALKMDRAKIQIGRISPFGLLEMSRQRLRPSISETSTVPCPHCHGKGVVRSNSSISLQIIRTLEKEAAPGIAVELKLFVTTPVAVDLLNTRRDAISSIEQKYAVKIMVVDDDNVPHGNFRIEKVKNVRRNTTGNVNNRTPVSMEQAIMDTPPVAIEEIPETASVVAEGEEPTLTAYNDDMPPRRSRRGRGKRGGRNFQDRNPQDRHDRNPEESSPSYNAPKAASEGGENGYNREEQGRGERGGRRRSRRWRDRRPRANENTNNPENREHSAYQQQPRPAAAEAPAVAPQPSPPPLEQQAPQDTKPKKGWWRRIVEA